MLVRFLKTVLYGLVGGLAAMIGSLMFIAMWTSAFKRVPLNHVWQYMRQRPPYAVFVTAFVAVAILAGVVVGAVKGLRSK